MELGRDARGGGFAADTGDGVITNTFYAVGQFAEAMIDSVEFFLRQIGITEIAAALFEGVTSAVFAENEFAFGHANRFGIDDLVGRFFLEVAVLVDTGLDRKSVV